MKKYYLLLALPAALLVGCVSAPKGNLSLRS